MEANTIDRIHQLAGLRHQLYCTCGAHPKDGPDHTERIENIRLELDRLWVTLRHERAILAQER
jgi:hypothetical protein